MVSLTPNNPDQQAPSQGLDCTEHFTPESASKLLPLIERIVREMSELSDDMDGHRAQLSGLSEIQKTIVGNAYEDELEDVRRSFLKVEEQFNSCQKELKALGVETHEPFDGAVDFPANLDRRRVNLCWRPGETAVTHWHELHEGGEKRNQLDETVFSGSAV